MTDERLIKSVDRIRDFGEVFTPKNIVNLMLDQPEISTKVNIITPGLNRVLGNPYIVKVERKIPNVEDKQ